MIAVEQGFEYEGETYIYCTGHPEYHRYAVQFTGGSAAELQAFLTRHGECA